MEQEFDPHTWLSKHGIERVEIVMPDMGGQARGKILPLSHFLEDDTKLPLAIIGQTINGNFYLGNDNGIDRDLAVRADFPSLRLLPWASGRTACALMELIDEHGSRVESAPRAVLQRVLALYGQRDWFPIIAPEVEFYLAPAAAIRNLSSGERGGRESVSEMLVDPYGTGAVHRLADFFEDLFGQCRLQGISIGAISQELGPCQFEVNLDHGPPLKLADDVFHFKRTLKKVAGAHGLQATFLAKLDAAIPGSSMHVHQSIYDSDGNNIFSDKSGNPSLQLSHYIGGLQRYMVDALLLFAPFPNSYRRFIRHWSSPVNLEWGVENRTAGLRLPDAPPQARRVENRLAGSDANPYLAIAATLACGYRGLVDAIPPRPAMEGSAYDVPFALLRHEYQAISRLRDCAALREVLGDTFVDLYTSVKARECVEFEERVPAWELRELSGMI